MPTHPLRQIGMLLVLISLLAACGSVPDDQAAAPHPTKTYQNLVVGFAQIGAESAWRVANTLSIQETAATLGVQLKFEDAQQQQANQIRAIRSFIAQKVDIIGLSPVVEAGWDQVFQEAKTAGIPVI